MYRLKLSLLVLLVAASAATIFAQSESQIESDEVKRVGNHLSCQCGACNENLNCMMSAGQCHFCKPARTRIFKMQNQGMSDSQVVASFVMQYGEKIFRHDPNSYFWLVPYISLGIGAVAIFFILRRMRGHQPMKPAVAGGAPPIHDATLARYREAIEKDTDRLE
ncbi:MAG: cytochrome c-type biogenesis protein CcmH [Acidobacteriota bacterium]|nr:cytochrome c-type biogenesis protein CcmH [Acidobacteriota bacterium]